MRLLLDTHALLWWLNDPSMLKEEARLAIANGRSAVYVSAISILEIAVKEATGKLTMPETFLAALEACRFAELPLTVAHAAAMRHLPPVHKDPFDRALVAQAQVETLTMVSRDSILSRYGISLVAA